MLNRILMLIMATGAVVGGIDRIFGNRLGYGKKFEEGFSLLGPTALSMVGMICLAPFFSDVLGRVIIPLYRLIGVDPGMFGSILAIDMGGYQLAGELAENAEIGKYAGIVAASVFGCTMVFTIPVGMGIIAQADKKIFAKGIMIGMITMPVGLLTGGIVAGMSLIQSLHQNAPVFILASFLLLGLWKMPGKIIKGFQVFAGGIRVVITAGLVLGAVEYMCGLKVIKNMVPIEEAMATVSSIGIVMLGSLPVAEFLQRILKKPFEWLGERCGMNRASVTGLLVGSVSAIPAITMIKEMDERGKVVNAAFLVSMASLLAAHIGFTVSAAPEMLGALMAAKLAGGAAAIVLAMVLTVPSVDKGERGKGKVL